MAKRDTIVAIATALGRSGIGVVRVSGAELGEFTYQLLGRRLPARRAVLAKIRGAEQELIDEGILLYFPGPNSYTGEDVLELQGHGGPLVMQLLVQRCLELGARLAEPGEFTKRAYLNGRLDLAQAEAVADLIDASTVRAARSALGSLQGVFSNAIADFTRELKELRALVEATLDFPEEEIDFLKQADARGRLVQLQDRALRILAASRQGQLLREGLHVVLAGRPNVGKSSLLNRLAGEELAIVTAIPGTTRDPIRLSVDLEGLPVHFIDTAGLRDTRDPVEQLGVARSRDAIGRADVALLVMDSTEGETTADSALLGSLPAGQPCIRIMNKIDLVGHDPKLLRDSGPATVWLSALTGAGMDLLQTALREVAGWQNVGEDGLYMARRRHVEALERAQTHLEQALPVLDRLELCAEELRLAQKALSSITGEYTTEELLGEIFSRFCIGK